MLQAIDGLHTHIYTGTCIAYAWGMSLLPSLFWAAPLLKV